MTMHRLDTPGTGVALAPSIAHLFSAATLLLAGAIAGFFYAYSSSVMPGLDATQANHAIAAMQAINSKVRNTVFFVAFFGMPVAAFVTAALLFSVRQRIAATLFLIAGVTYLVGAFLPTVLVNVPMNDALAVAEVPADPKESAKL